MPNILQLLLILIGSLAISGLIILFVVFDVSMNKLYKEEMKQKMIAKKTLVTVYFICTCLLFLIGYIIFI